MDGKIKKLKDNNGLGVYPVTRGEAVFVEDNKTLNQKLSELSTMQPTTPTTSEDSVLKTAEHSAKLPTVVFIFDDTMKYYYDNRAIFLDRGIRFTSALRQDYIGVGVNGGTVTYDMVRQMQDEGFEFTYHGTKHNFTVAELEADINSFMEVANRENILINGFVGPNGLYDETIIFRTFLNLFKWARGSGANGVANVGVPMDYFKALRGDFIDDLTSDAALTTLKAKIDTLAMRGTGVLPLSMHWSSTQQTYLISLLDYILASGIQIKTVYEAWEDYGGVIEYFSSSIETNRNNLLVRTNGNETYTENPVRPHFILQRDGTIISNFSPVRLTEKKKGLKVINGNTLPSEFDIGISITQYGSVDDVTNLSGGGTLYTYNLGKNTGNEQFQIVKNSKGFMFREAKTDGTWNTFDKKLGMFKTTVPAGTNATGVQGDYAADSNYIYVCYANNSWIRIAKDNTWTTTI